MTNPWSIFIISVISMDISKNPILFFLVETGTRNYLCKDRSRENLRLSEKFKIFQNLTENNSKAASPLEQSLKNEKVM